MPGFNFSNYSAGSTAGANANSRSTTDADADAKTIAGADASTDASANAYARANTATRPGSGAQSQRRLATACDLRANLRNCRVHKHLGRYGRLFAEEGKWEAATKLSELYLKKLTVDKLVLQFPDIMSRAEQLSLLVKVEIQTIAAVEAKMNADIAKLTPFPWDAEQDRQRKQAVVDEDNRKVQAWARKARSEANSGSNWSHNWSSNQHTFDFQSEAYQQAQSINLNGWGGL